MALELDLGALATTLGHANVGLVLAAIAGLVAVHLLGATTWRALAGLLTGSVAGWRTMLRLYYIGQGLGGLTPANLGSDAYRAYAIRGHAPGWRSALAPIVVQRITSSLALGALGALSLWWLAGSRDLRDVVLGGLVAIAILVAVVTAVALALDRRDRRPGPRSSGAGSRWRRMAGTGLGLLLGAAFHVASLAFALMLVAAVTPIPDPTMVLAALAVARLSILIPVTPSGLGVQEGALAILFVQIGLPAEAAIAAALLNRVALVAVVGLSAILLQVQPRERGTGHPTADQPRRTPVLGGGRSIGPIAEARRLED